MEPSFSQVMKGIGLALAAQSRVALEPKSQWELRGVDKKVGVVNLGDEAEKKE